MANKWLHATGGTGNFSDDSGTFRTSDQGETIASHPVDGDIVYCTANAGARVLTIDVASACSQINATGFTGEIAGTGALQAKTGFLLSAGMTWSHTGQITFGTSNSGVGVNIGTNRTFYNNFIFTGTGAKSVAGGLMTCKGLVTWSGNCNFTTSDSSSINIDGGWAGGANYFNDNSNNPKVYLREGLLSGVLPNTMAGLYYDGQVEGGLIMAPATGGTSSTTIREGTKIYYVDGSYPPVFTDNQTTFVAITSDFVMDMGSACPWNRVQLGSGTYTLLDNWYVNGIQTITGSPQIKGAFKIYDSAEFISYGSSATWSSPDGTFLGVELTGNCQLFDTTSFSDQTLSGPVTINIPIIINTAGTVTFEPKTVSFGGGGSLTKVAGTVVTTGFTAQINGEFSIDWLNGSFPEITFSSYADILNILDDFSVGTQKMYGGYTINIADGKEYKVTVMKSYGNDAYSNTIQSSGNGKFTYLGTMEDCQIVKTDFINIDACDSTIPLYTWYGSTTNSCGVEAVTGDDIGGFISVNNF